MAINKIRHQIKKKHSFKKLKKCLVVVAIITSFSAHLADHSSVVDRDQVIPREIKILANHFHIKSTINLHPSDF